MAKKIFVSLFVMGFGSLVVSLLFILGVISFGIIPPYMPLPSTLMIPVFISLCVSAIGLCGLLIRATLWNKDDIF